jgi:pyruvate/2-oxoglutarate dehydrogenase complex dihydrolipoamide acyltransferase (E2) component
MKITELLVESQQLDEGPFTQAIGKVGGKIAKGAAAIGRDLKTGFKAGYSGEEPAADPAATADAAAPATQAAPVKKQAAPAKVAATSAPAAEPTATTAEPAPAEEPAAKPAATADGTDAAAIKKELDSFLQTYKKDLAMQNKNWEFVTPKVNALEKQVADLVAAGSAAAPAPAAEPAVTPAAEPAPKARGGKVAGELSQSPSAVRRREQRARGKAAPDQATIDADRERNIGMTSDSVIRTGASLSETLARKVQEQRQRMFETALMSGTQSVFKK